MSLTINFTISGNNQGIFIPGEGCFNSQQVITSFGYILNIPESLPSDNGECFPSFTRPDDLIQNPTCNVLWRFYMYIVDADNSDTYVPGTYTGVKSGNASTLDSSTFNPWGVTTYLNPCGNYKIVYVIETFDESGEVVSNTTTIPFSICQLGNNPCYTLIPCDESDPVLYVLNDFSFYVNQTIFFEFNIEEEGVPYTKNDCYTVTTGENCCDSQDIVGYVLPNGDIIQSYQILSVHGNCESCGEDIPSNCWDIELCNDVVVVDVENPENPPTVLYPAGTVLKTTEDLSAFNGFYLKLKFEYCVPFGSLTVCPIDTTVCAKISESNICIDAVPLNDLIPFPIIVPGTKSVTIEEGLFESCACEELTPPPPPTPEPEPPCIFKPVCSVHQIKKALCDFAENIYNKMLERRFGIKNCCPKNDEKLLIKKEQVDVARKYDSRYCGDCEDCV